MIARNKSAAGNQPASPCASLPPERAEPSHSPLNAPTRGSAVAAAKLIAEIEQYAAFVVRVAQRMDIANQRGRK